MGPDRGIARGHRQCHWLERWQGKWQRRRRRQGHGHRHRQWQRHWHWWRLCFELGDGKPTEPPGPDPPMPRYLARPRHHLAQVLGRQHDLVQVERVSRRGVLGVVILLPLPPVALHQLHIPPEDFGVSDCPVRHEARLPDLDGCGDDRVVRRGGRLRRPRRPVG